MYVCVCVCVCVCVSIGATALKVINITSEGNIKT